TAVLHGPVGAAPLEHVEVLPGQAFAQQDRVRGAVADAVQPDRGAVAVEHPPHLARVGGIAVGGAARVPPVPGGGGVAVDGERRAATVGAEALGADAPHVVAGRPGVVVVVAGAAEDADPDGEDAPRDGVPHGVRRVGRADAVGQIVLFDVGQDVHEPAAAV